MSTPANTNEYDIIDTQALIIGAGPVGLFAVFQLGMVGISAHVLDILPRAGGQCVELYPDKPIFDIPSQPRISGGELIERLLQQAAPFEPTFHFKESAQTLERIPEDQGGGFIVASASGKRFRAPVVVIAAGGGAIAPKRPPLKGLEEFEEKSVFYAVREPQMFRGKRIVVAGGGDSALDWAIELAPLARHLTLLHRREEFRAAPASVARMREMVVAGEMDFRLGQIAGLVGENGVLQAVRARHAGETFDIAADVALLFFGLAGRLGALEKWGYELRGGRIVVDTQAFETSIPGVFAIGDVCDYPGKLKLILSGFHEAALMAQKAAKYVFPDRHIAFEHSTSSSILAEKLGQG